MSFTFADLDLSDISESSSLGIGVHLVEITNVNCAPRSQGERPVVELELNANGATYTDTLRVWSESEAGARISRQRLKQYLVATDHDDPNTPGDINWFLGKRVKVKIEPGKAFVRDDGSTGNYKNVTAVYKPDAEVSDVVKPASQPALAIGSTSTFDDDIPF